MLLEARGADGATVYRRAEEIQSGLAAGGAAAGAEEDVSAIVSADEQSAQVRVLRALCPMLPGLRHMSPKQAPYCLPSVSFVHPHVAGLASHVSGPLLPGLHHT